MPKPDRLYSPIYWTLSKPKTCLNQTGFTVLSTEPWVNQKPAKPDRLYSFIYWTLSKPITCLNQTGFTVPSTKCLCNFNLSKPNTCLKWTNSSVPKGFSLDRFHCCIGIHDSNMILNKHWSIQSENRTETGFGLVVMVSNATFNNISVISRQSVSLVEETGVPRKKQPTCCKSLTILYWQTITKCCIKYTSSEQDSNSQR